MAIWQSLIPTYLLVISVHVSLNACWQFGDTLWLNRIDRVSSFYWTRRSKLCFLTRFSYFSCYLLILVFLQNCYSLISLRLSWMHRNQISCPVFLYLWNSEVVRCMCAPILLAQKGFLEARCRRQPGSWLTISDLSPFHLLLKVSGANVRWANANHIFFTHTNPQAPLSCVT